MTEYSRDAHIKALEQESEQRFLDNRRNAKRIKFLKSGDIDADGYLWGVVKLRIVEGKLDVKIPSLAEIDAASDKWEAAKVSPLVAEWLASRANK